ncbi:MAG: hypothetical protein L0Y56_02815, partial [Nitrospira sp.]|nr:hypothetical protein [Nitrospira sp.]
WQNSLVVDATDMADVPRLRLWKALRDAGAKMLRASYEGGGRLVVSPSLPFASALGERGGYFTVPSYSQSVAIGGIAAMAIQRALKTGRLTELQVTLGDEEVLAVAS